MKVRNVKANWNKIIAVLQIVGGALGAGLAIYLIFSMPPKIPMLVGFFVFFLCLFLLSIVAGLFLWEGHPLCFTLSLIVQALQIPQFTIGGFKYMFVSGLELTVGIGSNGSKFFWNIGILQGEFQFSFLTQGEPSSLGLNIAAILFFMYLFRQQIIASRANPV